MTESTYARLKLHNKVLTEQLAELVVRLHRLMEDDSLPMLARVALMCLLQDAEHMAAYRMPPRPRKRRPWDPRKQLKGPLTMPDDPFITWAEHDARQVQQRRKQIRIVR